MKGTITTLRRAKSAPSPSDSGDTADDAAHDVGEHRRGEAQHELPRTAEEPLAPGQQRDRCTEQEQSGAGRGGARHDKGEATAEEELTCPRYSYHLQSQSFPTQERLAGIDLWRRGAVPERAVRPDLVVLVPPRLGQDLGFEQGVEAFAVEMLIAEPAVEGLDVAVLPGTSRLDESVCTPIRPSHRRTARATNSGPLSERM